MAENAVLLLLPSDGIPPPPPSRPTLLTALALEAYQMQCSGISEARPPVAVPFLLEYLLVISPYLEAAML